MKTDTIFYSLFKTFPSSFFELINQSPSAAVAYEFTSREIKQLSLDLPLEVVQQVATKQSPTSS